MNEYLIEQFFAIDDFKYKNKFIKYNRSVEEKRILQTILTFWISNSETSSYSFLEDSCVLQKWNRLNNLPDVACLCVAIDCLHRLSQSFGKYTGILRILYRIFCYSIYDHYTDNYPIEELGYKGLLPYFTVYINIIYI